MTDFDRSFASDGETPKDDTGGSLNPVRIPSIVVITQWYTDPSEIRREELLQAVAQNLRNPHIDEVHLLHEPSEDVSEQSLTLAFRRISQERCCFGR